MEEPSEREEGKGDDDAWPSLNSETVSLVTGVFGSVNGVVFWQELCFSAD